MGTSTGSRLVLLGFLLLTALMLALVLGPLGLLLVPLGLIVVGLWLVTAGSDDDDRPDRVNCTDCGSPNPTDADDCGYCGAPL